ncbi:MAG: regulator [Gammaproteobacteria bacterium]|nr:MAG: regulator [Gammaproteobacteria bacterium]
MSKSITTRLIVLLTLCSTLIIGIGLLVDYRLSRGEILERLRTESRDTVKSAIIDLENLLDGVEGSTLFLARILEQRDYTQPGLKQMLKDIVENNEDIYGATIALNPERVDNPLGFAPYYHHKDGILTYADLASRQYDYHSQAWYTDTVTAGKPIWVEPYYDEGGGEILMTTFAVPVYRVDGQGDRFLYAVVTADLALGELHRYLQRLRLGESGFATMLSRTGIILSGKNPANIMRHYSEAHSDELDSSTWREMFSSALAGQAVTHRLECPEIYGRCVIRMDTLQSTGWPVAVIYSEKEILAPLREFQTKSVVLGLFTLLLMALAVYFVTRRLTRPLTALAQASDDIARGELSTPLPSARGDDEVARLVRSFTAMKKDLKSYIADLEAATANRSRVEGELAAASEIQMSMLPQGGEAIEQFEEYALWAKVRPAKSVGGDLYSYYRSGRQLFIAVGDVSDKGVPAALFMAKAISLIQQLTAAQIEPSPAMAQLNNDLEAGNDNCMFVTLFLGVLDLDNLQLRFASAGHTPPSLLRAGTVEVLEQDDGPALGLATDLDYPGNTVQLEAGDRLAIYTDGIDEAFNEKAQMFGFDRFNDCLAQTGPAPLAVAGPNIFAAIDRHAGTTPQSDDISLMLLQLATATPGPATNSNKVSVTGVDKVSTAGVNKKSASFQRGVRLIGPVQDWLQQMLENFGVAEEHHMVFALIAEEIVTNIDKYGELPAGGIIDISVEASAARVTLEFRDEGVAFNPLQDAQRATLGADIESAEIGGLGVHLVTQLTDEQFYHRIDGHNVLRVTKLLQDV